MLTKELLLNHKDNLSDLVDKIDEEDVRFLVSLLKEKDDNIRYAAFLLLQTLSNNNNQVYKYWDIFEKMIDEDNSYQRSLGLMLISENIKWDKEDKFRIVCNKYLQHCDDEKFITARQCIQGLNKIIEFTSKYNGIIQDSLLQIDLNKRKDSQKGLLLMDIIGVLGNMSREKMDERVEAFFKKEYELGNSKLKKELKKYLM